MANLVEMYHVADGGEGLRLRQTSKNPVGTSLRSKYSKLYFWRPDLNIYNITNKQTDRKPYFQIAVCILLPKMVRPFSIGVEWSARAWLPGEDTGLTVAPN